MGRVNPDRQKKLLLLSKLADYAPTCSERWREKCPKSQKKRCGKNHTKAETVWRQKISRRQKNKQWMEGKRFLLGFLLSLPFSRRYPTRQWVNSCRSHRLLSYGSGIHQYGIRQPDTPLAYQRAKSTCQQKLHHKQNQRFSQKVKDIEKHAATNNSKEF